jgi:hypothetical protein
LTVGDSVTLINAADATAGNVKVTNAVAIAQGAAGVSPTVTIHNGTNQTATVMVAPSDADALYNPLTDANTNQAITVATLVSAIFLCAGPLLRVKYATAPSTGTLVITR